MLCMSLGVVAAGCSGNTGPSAQARRDHDVTTTRAPSSPGVLANCTAAPPQHIEVEPAKIVVACADAGIGAQDLVWHSWRATTATATGVVWENNCTPTCASGTIGHYPASITLSDVQPSNDGPTFVRMTATYRGAEPNGHATDTFDLEKPLA